MSIDAVLVTPLAVIEAMIISSVPEVPAQSISSNVALALPLILKTVLSMVALPFTTQLEVKVTAVVVFIRLFSLSTISTNKPNVPPALIIVFVMEDLISPSTNSLLSSKYPKRVSSRIVLPAGEN